MSIERNIPEFIERSSSLRKRIFDMAVPKKKGHVPSSFSQVELLNALYFSEMHYNSQNPEMLERDRLIISKGHGAMAAYPILAELGYVPETELEKFTCADGVLRQYADNSIPGVECVTGSLGHGIGIAAGYGLAARQDRRDSRTYVIISDGEYWEGSVTEAARFAAHKRLDNVITIVDRNRLVILGDPEDLVSQEPMEEQWASLGWFTQRIDGHSYEEIFGAFDNIRAKTDRRPSVIIADTIKGKGIPSIEGNKYWHNKFAHADGRTMEGFRSELDTNYITR